MLHPAVLHELLEDEIAAAEDRLGSRVKTIERRGDTIVLALDDDLDLVLDGARYDAEPLRVTVALTDGQLVPHEGWPAGMSLGLHPVLERPFACIQGTYEYHCHPSHLSDHWAIYRNTLRLPDLLDHLLRKANR